MLNNSFETYRRDRGRWYGHNIWLGRKYFNPERRRHRNWPYYNRFYSDEDDYDENICPLGYHYHPEHEKSDIYGCMKDSDMVENYEPTNMCAKNMLIGASTLIFICALFYMSKSKR
jgi:hypothetical protein